MVYIEDLVERIAGYGQWIFTGPQIKLSTPFEEKFINSVAGQVANRNGLTEKQSLLAIRILKTVEPELIKEFGPNSFDLNNPQFRLPIRTISQVKKIEIDESVKPNKIKVFFPYNEAVVKKIHEYKQKNPGKRLGDWDHEEKCWVFNLVEQNITFIQHTLVPEGFTSDDAFKDYVAQVKEIETRIEEYLPMLTLIDNKPRFKNTHPTVPQLESDNIIDALFKARKYGITTVDDAILDHPDYIFAGPLAKVLLNTYNHIWVNKNEHPIEVFKEVIDHAQPLLVVIPGGNEYEHIQKWHKLLNLRGVTNEQISVMFRLPNEGKGDFNLYVRDNHLNNELTENTKAVFISVKVPKPLIKSEIKFNAIVNLGYYMNTHYSLETLLRSAATLIFYTDQEPKINTYGYR